MAVTTYDPHANLADSTVATAPSPATSGTTLTLTAGQATWFPVGTFQVTIGPAGQALTRANSEVARATRASGSSTLTLVRAQEGTTARAIVVGDRVVAGVTAQVLADVEAAVARVERVRVRPSKRTVYPLEDGSGYVVVNQAGTETGTYTFATHGANAAARVAINAACVEAGGTFTSGGHNGGGAVQLVDHLYLVDAPIVPTFGMSAFLGVSRGVDRGGATYSAGQAQTSGTCIRATTVGQRIVQGGQASTGTPAHRPDNPHGLQIKGMTFDGNSTAGVGVWTIDLSDFVLDDFAVINCTSRGVEFASTFPPNTGGTVAAKVRNYEIFGCPTGIEINPTSGATDGEITSGRILSHSVVGINLRSGGWQITQSHFTTGQNAPHLQLYGSPSMISNNYFDTSGSSPQINLGTGNTNITGNYFTSSGAQQVLIDVVQSGGLRGNIVGNTADVGAGAIGFIRLPGTTLPATQPFTVIGNTIDRAVAAGFVAVVVTSAGAAVADVDTSPSGPYIAGNRYFLGG